MLLPGETVYGSPCPHFCLDKAKSLILRWWYHRIVEHHLVCVPEKSAEKDPL